MFNANNYNEEALLERLKAGDEAAFTEVYNRYHRGIFAYVLDFVKVSEMAEDLTHEVFMKIWEVREHLTINSSFSGYLYRVSHNKAIDALKKMAKDKALHTEAFTWTKSRLQEFNKDKEQARRYEDLYLEAVSVLPPQRQKIFILCREQGKTYEEAATELGISRNTAKQHMILAMRFLRNYLIEKGALMAPMIIFEIIF
ncbi:MAG: RNA polymerase sigma-70 factor [Flavitalea sp.]